MNKAIHLSKRRYTQIVGKQAPLDRLFRFGVPIETTEPAAASAQSVSIEIRSKWQAWQTVEDSKPDLSHGNRRSRKILQRNPYVILLQDVCAFAAISAFVCATCILSQEIAPKTISLREKLETVNVGGMAPNEDLPRSAIPMTGHNPGDDTSGRREQRTIHKSLTLPI